MNDRCDKLRIEGTQRIIGLAEIVKHAWLATWWHRFAKGEPAVSPSHGWHGLDSDTCSCRPDGASTRCFQAYIIVLHMLSLPPCCNGTPVNWLVKYSQRLVPRCLQEICAAPHLGHCRWGKPVPCWHRRWGEFVRFWGDLVPHRCENSLTIPKHEQVLRELRPVRL